MESEWFLAHTAVTYNASYHRIMGPQICFFNWHSGTNKIHPHWNHTITKKSLYADVPSSSIMSETRFRRECKWHLPFCLRNVVKVHLDVVIAGVVGYNLVGWWTVVSQCFRCKISDSSFTRHCGENGCLIQGRMHLLHIATNSQRPRRLGFDNLNNH